MAFTVMNNPSAMMSLGELNKNINNQGKSQKKLATGMKINGAGDDASAYAISERMRSHLRALNQDTDNVRNGRAMLSVAAGGIDSIVQELRNLKELAIKSANDSNTDKDRETIQKEFEQKMANIDDIATETNYNGKLLLDGRYGNKTGYTTIQEKEVIHHSADNTPVRTGTEVTANGDIMIYSGDYSVTAAGRYILAKGYTGTITIADGVQSVEITQEDPATELKGVSIEGPSAGNADLLIEDLNIHNYNIDGSFKKSAIRFKGSNNQLTIKGENRIKFSEMWIDADSYAETDKSRAAIISIGGGLTIDEQGDGSLDVIGVTEENTWLRGAGIGSDCKSTESQNADIVINGGTIKVYTESEGAAIGTGGGDGTAPTDISLYNQPSEVRIHNIIINGGKITAENATQFGGSAIGGGYWSDLNDILINSGDVTAISHYKHPVVPWLNSGGAGIGTGEEGLVNNIVINSSVTLYAFTDDDPSPYDPGIYTCRSSPSVPIAVVAENVGVGYGGIRLGQLVYPSMSDHPNATIDIGDNSGGNTGDKTGSDEIIYKYRTVETQQGDPLIIHHGPKANQALHCYINDMHTDAMGLSGTQVVTREAAQWALSDDKSDPPRIGAIDQAINYALNEATTVGAYISRLETTEDNLVISSENAQSSESTIRDADMAREMTEFTKNNVLAQASQSMLAQANQNSSSVLSLLQ